MANHKVLGDLLHVLVIEEGVEAQLVCRRANEGRKQVEISKGSVW